MSVHTGTNYRFFFCSSCSLEKPLEKKVRVGKFRVRCSDCAERAASGKPSSWINRGSRAWGDEDTADAIPASIEESYREAVSE